MSPNSIPRLFNFDKVDGDDFPDLIEVQKLSYNSFISESGRIGSILSSAFPISDAAGRFTLEFVSYSLSGPESDKFECMKKGTTYSVSLIVLLRLVIWDLDSNSSDESEDDEEDSDDEGGSVDRKKIKAVKEQEVYVGDLPLMTENATFIINGIERVVVSQMHRSPGVFYDHDKGKTYASGKLIYFARIIPYRGSWLDFEFDNRSLLYFRIDRKRKLNVGLLFKSLGMSDSDVFNAFYDKLHCKRVGDGFWSLPFNPQRFKGVRLEYDLRDSKTRDVLVKSGTRITTLLATSLAKNGLTHYLMSDDNLVGMFVFDEIVENSTSTIVAQSGSEITSELIKRLDILAIDEITILGSASSSSDFSIRNSLLLVSGVSRENSLMDIYRIMRPGEIPTPESSESLFESTFFDSNRYDLSSVGRVKLNLRFGNSTDDVSNTVLTKQDIINVVKELVNLHATNSQVDDIDHLGNRRVRSVGEFTENQLRIGLARMQRAVIDYMSMVDMDSAMPCDLINSRILVSVIREFFSSSQLSQFMDQTNPLSEITHKRRLSALGPGGLVRDRAGFEVRDVHPTHYGRICPIETPEGQNIGLINSLATYARINQYGFIEAAYRKVNKGIVLPGVTYLSAIDEGLYNIAQSDVPKLPSGEIEGDFVRCRRGDSVIDVPKDQVDFVDVSPKQVVSIAASLIPFLENDDANRALMGSNMQRQAVPLLTPEAPIVGTGMERLVAENSRVMISAKRRGEVLYVDSERIIIGSDSDDNDFYVDVYNLRKFQRSNHGTCINQKPLKSIFVGSKVAKDEVITDGPATQGAELALGRNLLAAFMVWRGYNFEDSIVVSEEVISKDMFSSVHIEEFECVVRDTRLGPEEIVRELSSVSEERLYHLDEFGIVHIGASVNPGDVLVGKITPKSESPMTAEEKLLRAIFGEKTIDMRDTSLCLPPGASGTVVDVHVFVRRGLEKEGRTMLIEQRESAALKRNSDSELEIVNLHAYKMLKNTLLCATFITDFRENKSGAKVTESILDSIPKNDWWNLDVDVKDKILLIKQKMEIRVQEIHKALEYESSKIKSYSDLPQGVLSIVKVFIAVKNNLQPGDKMSGRHGNKGVISRIVPKEDMPRLKDGTPVEVVLNPLGVPSRMNAGQVLETHLGWASYRIGNRLASLANDGKLDELRELFLEVYRDHEDAVEIFSKMSQEELVDKAKEYSQGIPIAAPVFEAPKDDQIVRLLKMADLDESGQEYLYDGITGNRFDRKVTVGKIYMLKLHHLVDDKIHARSIGPYSLVTQQPLGGKSYFGGQRFGEMEAWALQAYGAAYTLREMLTVKSDDVVGRVKMYESIVNGDCGFSCCTPESFNVVVNECKGLCLDIQLLEVPKDDFDSSAEGDSVSFSELVE